MAHLTIWQAQGIHVRYSGQSCEGEIAGLMERLQADSRYDDVRFIVHDFRNSEGLSFSQAGIEELAAKDAAAALSTRQHKIAVIGVRPEVEAMVKTYLDTGFHPHQRLRLFADFNSAWNWLRTST